ncbi:MAG: hypothetical protein ABI356_05070 [Steroidobacteraceae bacterium]
MILRDRAGNPEFAIDQREIPFEEPRLINRCRGCTARIAHAKGLGVGLFNLRLSPHQSSIWVDEVAVRQEVHRQRMGVVDVPVRGEAQRVPEVSDRES